MQSRTHTCGELRKENAGEKVTIVGWMENVREVGANLAFVIMRDFYGITQVVIENEEMMAKIKPVNKESTLKITGTVPYAEGFKPTDYFYCYDGDELVPDDMSHEQVLVIRESEGLYVFSGCSHRGVISALNAAKSMFPGEKVAALIAGMHLYAAKKPDRQKVIDEIVEENIKKVLPVHCTGIDAICELKLMLGDRCMIAQAGDEYLV